MFIIVIQRLCWIGSEWVIRPPYRGLRPYLGQSLDADLGHLGAEKKDFFHATEIDGLVNGYIHAMHIEGWK
jgi:hypothetical protein